MPATETKSRHPAVEPRELEPHEALDGDILYYISIYPPMPTGSVVVRAERPDGSNWLATEDEIPQKLKGKAVKDEFERRLREQTPPRFIDGLRKLTEDRAIYYNLSKEKSAQDFYNYVLKGLLGEAAHRKGGINSTTLRFTLSNDGCCTLPHQIAEDLKLLLKEEGFRLSIGNFISSEGHTSASVHIHWTISW